MGNTRRAYALDHILSTLPALRRMLVIIRRHDRNLEEQMRRAATSVALNLGEADGQEAGHRQSRLRTALGELRELRTGLKVAVAFGYVSEAATTDIDRRLDQAAAMTWRRLNPLP